jgi:predicted ester cyclase
MSSQNVQPDEAASKDAHRKLYASYLAYCNSHSFEAMEQFYTSPIKINDEPWAPSKVTAQFKPLVEAFPDWHWEIRHFAIDGNYLSLHFEVTGTHQGTFQGIEPTGRRVTTTQFTLYHVVDGKFTEVWDLTDTEKLLKQIQ